MPELYHSGTFTASDTLTVAGNHNLERHVSSQLEEHYCSIIELPRKLTLLHWQHVLMCSLPSLEGLCTTD